MELNKKKYANEEVREILKEYELNYEERLAEQKYRIAELVKDNKILSEKLIAYEYKDKLIAEAVKKSQEYLEDSKRKTEMQYSLNTEYLKNFAEKWEEYFNYLTDKYPMYSVTEKALSLKEKLTELLKVGDNVVTAQTLSETLDSIGGEKNSSVFNPKNKISEYIAATSDNGFNMEEVLNPGELRLEDICKELGLLEDDK